MRGFCLTSAERANLLLEFGAVRALQHTASELCNVGSLEAAAAAGALGCPPPPHHLSNIKFKLEFSTKQKFFVDLKG